MDDDLEIEFEKAEQSIEFDKGLAAHFQASANEKQRLLDLARQEHSNVKQLQQRLADTQSQNLQLQLENQQLRARIAELEARPTIYAEQYVGIQQVLQQHVQHQQVAASSRKRSAKMKYLNPTNQLELNLWPNATTSL